MSVDKLKERQKNLEYFDDFLRIVGDKKSKHDRQVSIIIWQLYLKTRPFYKYSESHLM